MIPSHLEQESYHTYIVFDVGAEEKENYELKMLQKHQLNGFLPFQLRSRDGNDCYYYEVPSDQTMEKSLKKGIHGKQIRDFSKGLMEALEVAAEYLMDENDIVLVPEYVYIDRNGRYQFLLFPGYKTDLSASLREVAASFLKAVDYKDRTSVQEVYEYYHLMCAGKSTLRALREYVFIGPGKLPDGEGRQDEDLIRGADPRRGSDPLIGPDPQRGADSLKDAGTKRGADRASDCTGFYAQAGASSCAASGYCDTVHAQAPDDMPETDDSWTQTGPCGAGGPQVFRGRQLEEESVAAQGGWRSMSGSAGAAAQSGWSNAGTGHEGHGQGSREEQDTSCMGSFLILIALLCAELAAGFVCRKLFYQLPVKFLILICAVVMAVTFVVGWRILRNQTDKDDTLPEETRDHPEKNGHKKDEFWNSSDFISYDYIDPKTTLLNAHPRGLLLKSADIQICQDLHISEFPSVIGKDAADVRCKIPVSTVSRRHARLEALGTDYYLTDLHSSNGTFMNGEPLRPMTPKKIHMGDSITFSNVSFTVMEDAG